MYIIIAILLIIIILLIATLVVIAIQLRKGHLEVEDSEENDPYIQYPEHHQY